MRTRKTPQHTIDTRLCHRGSNPAPASSHPVPQPLFPALVTDPLVRLAVQATEARGQERLTAVFFPRVDFPTATLARASAGMGEPKKIRLRLFCWPVKHTNTMVIEPTFGAFGSVGRCQILLENEISIFKKLVSRRKHEVLQNVVVNGCSDVGFQKTQWTNTSR